MKRDEEKGKQEKKVERNGNETKDKILDKDKPRKLSFKEQKEFEGLEVRIAELEEKNH